MKWILAPVVAFLIAFIPTLALAEDGESEDNLLLRIGADVVVEANQTVGSLILIDGDAQIDGMVRNTVLVIDGDVVITGAVAADITVISGRIELRNGALVKNVTTIDSSLIRAEGATVTGQINESADFGSIGAVAAVFSLLFWLAMSVAVLAAGLVFAAIGGRQLNEAARSGTGDIVNTAISAVLIWAGVPVLAIVAMITLIGLPLGIGLLLFVLPAMWFLGYIVAGAALGSVLLGRSKRESDYHPYLATFVGLVLLQLGVLVPFFGAMVAFLAGLWGAGALALVAFKAAGGRPFWSGTTPADAHPQPAG